MLPRRLEPEVMDSPEEAADYDAMDHSAVNTAFVADFLAAWDGTGPVLDVGTGTARIPIELCRRHPSATVTAVDLANHMLALARGNVAAAGLADRVAVLAENARGLSFADNSFGAIVSNSIVHHIPEPDHALREMVRVCRPGGLLFVRDLLRPRDEDHLDELVELHAAGVNDHQKQMFHDSLHAALSLDEVRELVADQGFRPDDVRQTSDRHWTFAGRKPL